MPGRPPSKVIRRLVPGTSEASGGVLAAAIDAAPMTSGVSVLSALATRMRTRVPPSETRTRLRTVALVGPPVAEPVGDAPHAAIQWGVAAAAPAGAAPRAAAARATTTRRI